MIDFSMGSKSAFCLNYSQNFRQPALRSLTSYGEKVGEQEWEKAERVLEHQLIKSQGQDLSAHSDLVVDFLKCGITVLQDEHPVVSFQVVEDGYGMSVVAILVRS